MTVSRTARARRGLAAVAFVSLSLGVLPAEAALTSSEKGQIKDFVAAARVDDAGKVRALVARTDLAPEESSAILAEALAPVPFTEARGAFLGELVFGGASAPSRPGLVVATVKAVLARADAIYARFVNGGLEGDAAALEELVGLYGWIDAALANAGHPTAERHDPQAGIPNDAYETAAKVLEVHLKANARWLAPATTLPAGTGRVRAQAELAFVDMLPDGLTRRVDAANRLGLQGARKTALATWGILLTDDGELDEPRAQRARDLLAHLPGARAGLSLVHVGAPTRGRATPFRARGAAVVVSPGGLWPFAGPPDAEFDAQGAAIAYELAVVVARRALAARPELAKQVLADASAAAGDANRVLGRPRAPSVDHVLGAAVQALSTRADIAIELAAKRLAGGRPEPAALLADAIGALAIADAKEGKEATSVEVATHGAGKGPTFGALTAIKLGPSGAATAFTFDGHAFALERSGMTRDRAPYPAPRP